MPKAKLYNNFITREKRFANSTALNSLINSFTINADVVGCFITNTSSYVDIEFNYQSADDEIIHNFSYVIFDNSDGYPYCAFIDRIEPNNFNMRQDYNARAYRLYITIDWWSTIMLNDTNGSKISEIKSSLEGNVERAHVDDVQWLPSAGKFIPYMAYTTPVMETPSSDYLIEGKHLLYSDGNKYIEHGVSKEYNNDILWLYVIKRYKETTTIPPVPLLFSGDNDDTLPKVVNSCGGYIIAIPFKNGISYNYQIKDTLLHASRFPVGEITDSDVIHMFTSTIPPCKYEIVSVGEAENVVSLDYDGEALVVDLQVHGHTRSGIALQKIYGLTCLTLKDFLLSYGLNNALVNDMCFCSDDCKVPATYEDYLEKCVYKAGSEIYSRVYISCGNDVMQLKQTKVATFTLSHDYETGGLILRNYLNLFDHSIIGNVEVIGGNFTYRPIQVIDNLSYYRGMFAVSFSAGSSAFSAMTYNYGSAMNGTGATVDKMFSMAEQRRGNVQSQATGSLVNSYVYLPEITISVPVDIERIKIDLAKYGYTTMLHPHDVLQGHQRRYFNYIKCNNAKVLVNSYNTEIKLQIEEMFNNGVWLWNTADEFGNFEVPNYPIIMDT